MRFLTKFSCLVFLFLIHLSATTDPVSYELDQIEDMQCKLYIPNAFSPNGDGVNDRFKPNSNCDFREFEMRIFDRWGTLLFQSKNANEGWNGKYNGNEVASTAYVYYIRYRNVPQDTSVETFTEVATGNFALLR